MLRGRQEYEVTVFQAVKANNIELLQEYLEKGVSPDGYVDVNKNTALHLAVINNKPDLVALLLKHGANPTKENKDKKIALALAVDAHLRNCILVFARHNESKDYKAVSSALGELLLDVIDDTEGRYEKYDDVLSLLKGHAHLTWRFLPTKNRALHMAVVINSPAIIRLLIQYGSAKHSLNQDGETAILLAAKLRYWDCVIAIADQNPRISETAQYGEVLILAAHANRSDVVELLLKVGANPNNEMAATAVFKVNKDLAIKNFAQHEAAAASNSRMIALLKLKGADFTLENAAQQTPVAISSERNDKDSLEFSHSPKDLSTKNAKLILYILLVAQQSGDQECLFTLLPIEILKILLPFAFNDFSKEFSEIDKVHNQLFIHSILALHQHVSSNWKRLFSFTMVSKIRELVDKLHLIATHKEDKLNVRVGKAQQAIASYFDENWQNPPALEQAKLFVKFHLLQREGLHDLAYLRAVKKFCKCVDEEESNEVTTSSSEKPSKRQALLVESLKGIVASKMSMEEGAQLASKVIITFLENYFQDCSTVCDKLAEFHLLPAELIARYHYSNSVLKFIAHIEKNKQSWPPLQQFNLCRKGISPMEDLCEELKNTIVLDDASLDVTIKLLQFSIAAFLELHGKSSGITPLFQQFDLLPSIISTQTMRCGS